MAPKTYFERTLISIATSCKVRGIPEPEVGSVCAVIGKHYEVPLDEMNEPQLRRVNRELPLIMKAYLKGKKRRPEVVEEPKAEEEQGEGEVAAEG